MLAGSDLGSGAFDSPAWGHHTRATAPFTLPGGAVITMHRVDRTGGRLHHAIDQAAAGEGSNVSDTAWGNTRPGGAPAAYATRRDRRRIRRTCQKYVNLLMFSPACRPIVMSMDSRYHTGDWYGHRSL